LQEIIKEKGFDAPAVSEDEITEVAKGVLDANPQIVEQYKGGKVTVIGFFVGQVMKQTQGKANPKQIQEIMTRLLSA
ncbi:MAG: Asp-tRNA(Asn)/Glu-tRNA(Gln) amidotransferase GatCAB subunit B, partial [candidate division SR1 bacterium]|nr:Asp-tRNA(Asn)/Glu-tRNA(Gln) amidotransferase GatCAB subunit B [candidate division SR1 bacterium]